MERYSTLHGAVQEQENLKESAQSLEWRANCRRTESISVILPIPLSAETSASFGEAMLSSLPSSQRLVHFQNAEPSETVIGHDGESTDTDDDGLWLRPPGRPAVHAACPFSLS